MKKTRPMTIDGVIVRGSGQTGYLTLLTQTRPTDDNKEAKNVKEWMPSCASACRSAPGEPPGAEAIYATWSQAVE